jgi:FtsH-binding integral membrane protein
MFSKHIRRIAMTVHRKHIVVQLLFFIALAVMGADIALRYFVFGSEALYQYVVLGVLVTFFGIGLWLYRRPDPQEVIVTERELKLTKTLLYAAIVAYLLNMLVTPSFQEASGIVAGIASAAMVGVSITGIIVQLGILRKPKRL